MSISLGQWNTSVKVLSQMQGSRVTIEISSPVENVVAGQRTAAKATTRPQLPSRLITCSQTVLGDRELFPLFVRLQDLEHESMGFRVLHQESFASIFRWPAHRNSITPAPRQRRRLQGTSSGRDTLLKKFLATHREQNPNYEAILPYTAGSRNGLGRKGT